MKRARYALLSLLLAAHLAHATAAIEFMKMEAHQQVAVVKPLLIAFLQRGYKSIPREISLTLEIEKLVLEKGYTYQSIESTVAEEAAIRLGMKK